MINLLPTDAKRQLRAGRLNVILLNYCFLVVFAAVLIGVVFAVGFWVTDTDKANAEATRQESQAALAQYSEVRSQAEGFAKDLAAAQTILGSGVSFSQLMTGIASSVPSGVILSNLTLGETLQDAPIDITGRAKSYNDALRLKSSLETSDIFENVSLSSVSQSTEPGEDGPGSAYPFTVSLKAQFTKATSGGGN